MALLSNANLTIIMDKLARWCSESAGDTEFNNAFNAGMQLANTDVWSSMSTLILGLDDLDQEADLLPAARVLTEVPPVPPTGFLISVASVSAFLNGLDKHYKAFGYASLDAYLSAINGATPTLRAHGFFRRYLGKISAKNSFIPNDLTLGTFTASGATAGTFAHATKIDKTQYAGAKLVTKNNGVLTGTTGVSVTVTKLDGTTVVLTNSIATLTDGHETNLSDTTLSFIDATAVAVTGATSGDKIDIVAKTDRSIASA